MKSTRERPGYLFVICSSNQLYSGTGTALFEWIRYAKEYFRFAILMDCEDKRNFDIGREFCADNGIEFFSEIPSKKMGAPGPGVARIAHYLKSGRWQYVEIISWANTAANLDVVTSIPSETKLIFTPHTQPIWTIPDGDLSYLIEPVFRLCLERADLVCCDSPSEVANLRRQAPAVRASYVPIGVDDQKFAPTPKAGERRQILMVCDCVEIRKRVDLAVAAVERIMKVEDARFVMVGRGSDQVSVPADLESRVTRLGYVSENTLVSLYRDSAVFLLLSDCEAFGIPIVEALFCGTEVVINDLPETRSLYETLPGVQLVDNRDDDDTDAAILAALRGTAQPAAISQAATAKFSKANAFQKKLEAISRLADEYIVYSEERLLGWDVAL